MPVQTDLFAPAPEPAPLPVDVDIQHSWKALLKDEFAKSYFRDIKQFLLKEKGDGHLVYPPGKEIFKAFNLTPIDDLKVVVLGQDPYHGRGQAHGLCFSVPEGVAPPPSLVNIFKEIKTDLGIEASGHGNLEPWARQGVFLLNAMLTVRANKPASHQQIGWQRFTDTVIQKVSDTKEHVVFMLWGKFAMSKSPLVDATKHLILTAPHPSPYSASYGFFGCKHFSQANEYLQRKGLATIDWRL